MDILLRILEDPNEPEKGERHCEGDSKTPTEGSLKSARDLDLDVP